MYAGVPIRTPGSVTNVRDSGRRLETGQAEVQNLQPPVARPHDVFRLQIAMDDAARVRGGEGGRNLPRRAHDLGRRRTLPRGDLVTERDPVDEFGDDEQIVVGFLERIDGADSRVRQPGSGPRFAPQAFPVHRIARQMGRQRFERHLTPEARVRREIHPSHAAAAQLPDNRVGAQGRSGHQDGVVGQKLGNALDDRLAQESARAFVMIEQREDFVTDGGIVGSLPGGP